ncbi:MAG: ABC-F family ATP-binding cassette domain-containing protein [Cellulosilyticaceae bacterium]
MILLAATNISKIYGEKVVFDAITLGVDHTDKIGLIGINGTGKTSLLRILAGFEVADKGELTTSNELVLEYLPQNPCFEDDATVLEQIFKGESEFMKVLRSYEETMYQLEQAPNDTKLQEKLVKLSTKMDAQNAWQLESEAKAILTKLGITMFDAKVGTLSGGQRKRIALAGALIRPCNLLILDEPTNHLDNETIDYLEEILKAKKCALLMVTHDRYFLDRVTNKIVEIDEGKLYKYDGNYTKFLELKAERESIDKRMREKEQTLFKQELEWMRKGVEARRTKQKARQDRFYSLQENMAGKNDEKMDIGLSTSRLGKKIIEMKNINKSFGDKNVVNDFTYTVVRTDRIGIIGKNGLGKSTLLNIIEGLVEADSGSMDLGETVRIGYYSQENRDMDENLRVIDYIKEKAEFVKSEDGTMVSASKILERFLFPSSLQYTPIRKLSGGERRRLYLLGVLMNNINVLLLDEPTNDLDIQTLQILEDYIDQFDGPVITVSHDRYFLDKIAEKIFEFESEGKITSYPGNYSDYAQRQKQKITDTVKKEIKDKNTAYKEQKTQTKLKFSYKEKLEYDAIDDTIASLEAKLEELDNLITTNATNFSKLQEFTKQKEVVEADLEHQMERWEYLNELAEKINNQ